ncbi:bacterio-opsin activator domain-containing protein [Natrinema salaciae]|uniref:bacterio-opsin activator domain-containing protein n=1 Tax=Natrinema salaciae TaxID=1186196 RepID=UPI0015876E90|nr:bacterio-opsin activator domain-containing protein [Natrinema salaciae]
MAVALVVLATVGIVGSLAVPVRTVDLPLFDALPAVGLLGLVIPSDVGNAIARLTERIERFEAGTDDGDFSTDCPDELEPLADAIESMIATARERERRLERSMGFTNDVLDAIQDVFYVLDADGEIQCWNERLPELTRYSDEEVGSMHVLDFYEGDDEESIRAAVDTAHETGSTRVEANVRTADGEFVAHEFTGVALEDPDGNPVLAGIGRDVSDRKRLEADLRTEKAHFRVALENSPMIAFRMDTDLRYTWVSSPHPDFRREDVLGKRDDDLLPPGEAEKLMGPKRTVLETGEGSREEVTYDLPSGEVTYDLTVEPLRDESGAVTGLSCASLDVTDRKEHERDIERTRDLLRQTQRIAKVGGWELDLQTGPPYSGMLTDEAYRIHELSAGDCFDMAEGIEFYHPDDRPRIRAAVERAIETGDPYDLEVRLITADGNVRWVHTTGDPIESNGETVALRGALQDITDRKEDELALRSIHDATRELLNTETVTDVAELMVQTTENVLDVTGVGVYCLNSGATRLEPLASTAGFDDHAGDSPSVPVGDVDSAIWNAFVTGTQTVDDDPIERRVPFDGPVDGGVFVPISGYGVFVVLAPSAIDDETRRLVETLAATTEAAFDRLESEASLQVRDAELEERNRRLKRQIQINEIIRSINQSLIGATTREEIERTVCERLVANDDIAFAWIGSLDASETALQPHTWAGTNQEYLNVVDLETSGATPEPSALVARTEQSTVVSNVLDDLKAETWRRSALAYGFSSCLSVPIWFDEYSYGVLSVYGNRPDIFDDLERTVFEELGESIANSITAVKTRQALQADTLLELTLRFEGAETFLGRVARNVDCQVEYEGIATHSIDETRLFFSVVDGDPDAVDEALDALVSVRSHNLVNESADGCLFEATVTGSDVASRLVRHGARPRSIRATGTELEAVVDLPPASNVREFVGMLAEQCSSVELVARRDVQRTMHTREELVTSLFAELTERQLEVLKTAYYAGFFDWPRESTGEEIAEMLGVSQPTINRHLRLGQRRLLEQLFASDERAVAG